jgi:hypothetical protein
MFLLQRRSASQVGKLSIPDLGRAWSSVALQAQTVRQVKARGEELRDSTGVLTKVMLV